MAPPQQQRLRILSVGGNAVSAFISWRLQATQACDVTLVWKTGFDNVAQYGISMKSEHFGNERFKPHQVIRSPEDASKSRVPFDYLLICIKALPDVYDFAGIVESVVTPQHTCILINTTNALGVEQYVEQRFPTNVVLSLVSTAELVQLGTSEFEQKGHSTNIWVGPANRNPSIPATIQADMAEALAITLSQGQVDCQVSPNIRQQQYESVIGNIAFHPASVLFETSNHDELLEKVGVRQLISGVIDELLQLAAAQGCSFPADFKEKKMEEMIRQREPSIMYQDFVAKRPMEIETFLGSPLKIAQGLGVSIPRIETLYAMMHHLNITNRERPATAQPASPTTGLPPRLSSAAGRPPLNPQMNGSMKGGMPRPGRVSSMAGGPGMRRGPPSVNGAPPVNGYGRAPNGNSYGPGGSRRPSMDGNELEEFSHLMLYENIPEGEFEDAGGYGPGGADLALRERELALRQRELALREQELNMRRRRPPPGGPAGYDEDDDEDDYFDPMAMRSQGPPMNPDSIDMMSVTSRRTRKAPSASQLRKNPEMGNAPPSRGGRFFSRGGKAQNRASARMMADVPGLHESLMNNPMMGYSSDRYGQVDRQAIAQESRANSLTAARLDELQQGGGGYGGYPPMNRRTSQSPGNTLSPGPGQRVSGRPSPPNGYGSYANGGGVNGRPSPPGMRQPVPRHPPGHGNAVAPHQVEQHVGVSNLYPPKMGREVRSLTGSASASQGSGDSASAHIDSENSAHSSQSSLGPRRPIGVRG